MIPDLKKVGDDIDKMISWLTETIVTLESNQDELLDCINDINGCIEKHKDMPSETLKKLQDGVEEAKETLKTSPKLIDGYKKALKDAQEIRTNIFLKTH